ncbi:MAG: DUF3179 domain-containing (seleno)protein [Acidimicrobiales bacterium]
MPTGPLDPDLVSDLDALFEALGGPIDPSTVERIGRSGDARVAWLLSDLLRFLAEGELEHTVRNAWQELTGQRITEPLAWGPTTDLLIAWDLPAPPAYVSWKRRLFELIEPGWAPFFDDVQATIDWRLVSWGGVRIDDRPLDSVASGCPDGCIPALDDPAVTDAQGGDWYPDDAVVFGLEVDGAAMAFPKNIMEVHEMVNLTLGGRRIALPYCTLCGSAQAYLTDRVADGVALDGAEVYELRTSGLLSRSNKVMFELHTRSVFDTFTGVAVTGPLREAGVQLEQLTVVTSTWGEWKRAHPGTVIIAEDGGIGRSYPSDPLRGRDDDGPIFPVGDVDQRLSVQEPVVGVVLSDGTALAFPAARAAAVLALGGEVGLAGVVLDDAAGGLTALDEATGEPITSHRAFWFAWSQFHPETMVWLG